MTARRTRAMDMRGQETRARILAATVEVIGRDGWEAVTVRKIAAAADVNAALVNYHFGTKANLMMAALESALEHEVVEPMRATFADSEPDRVLEELVRLTLGPELPDAARRVFESALTAVVRDRALATRVRPMLDTFRALLAHVFDQAIAAGRIPATADAQALAVAFTAMLDGLWLHQMVDPDMPAERIADAVAHLFRDTTR